MVPEPRAEVYCYRLNFNISKLVYSHINLEFHFLFSVDEETNEAWDSTCNSFDNYEELNENIYSKELEQLNLNSIQVCLLVTVKTLFVFIYNFQKFQMKVGNSLYKFAGIFY